MSWRFALSPKWIIRHVLVAALVATMVSLGFWQLRRLDEKRDHKAVVEARQELAIAPVLDVVPAAAAPDSSEVEAVLYRSVEATGTYDGAASVIVPNRTYSSAPGAWVLTPLDLDGGGTLIVNRGFIGFDRDGELVAPAPPAGTVTVDGLLFPNQERERFGAGGPSDERLAEMPRVDLPRYATRLGRDVLPAYIQLVSSEPAELPAAAGAAELVALAPPEPDEGPHLSYAVQWFLFTAIAAGGYALLLRKVAIDRARDAETAVPVD